MALKDWKKVGANSWDNASIKEILSIKLEKDLYMRSLYKASSGIGDYRLEIRTTEWPLSLISRYDFKTNSQALKFAKEYMRTH